MNDSNLPNNPYAAIWKFFFLDTPVGKLIFVMLVLLGSAFYIKFFGWPFDKERDCSGRVTLVGILLNEKNRTPLEGVTAHFATFAKDETDSHGLFSVEGIEIPESKIITLRVEFQGGKHLEVEGIDLRNNVKYPVKECKIDLGQILVSPESAKYTPASPSQTEPFDKNRKLVVDRPGLSPLPATSTYFNEEGPTQIAIISAGKSEGLSVSNLKYSLVNRWKSEGISSSTSIIQPGFSDRFASELENENMAALLDAGLGSRTNCLCFLKLSEMKSENATLKTDGEEHNFEKASGVLDVKFFALKTGKVTSFSISETGAGGNRARAFESLTDKFITQFFNHKLSLGVCKN